MSRVFVAGIASFALLVCSGLMVSTEQAQAGHRRGCGGGGGLFAHKKDCGGGGLFAHKKDCGGGGLLARLHARKSDCGCPAPECAPAPCVNQLHVHQHVNQLLPVHQFVSQLLPVHQLAQHQLAVVARHQSAAAAAVVAKLSAAVAAAVVAVKSSAVVAAAVVDRLSAVVAPTAAARSIPARSALKAARHRALQLSARQLLLQPLQLLLHQQLQLPLHQPLLQRQPLLLHQKHQRLSFPTSLCIEAGALSRLRLHSKPSDQIGHSAFFF